MNTYYHVTGTEYKGGDLYCRDFLNEIGLETEWKWEDADDGFDGDVVCVFNGLEEAREFKTAFCPDGEILKVTVAQIDIDEPMYHDTPYGIIYPKITTVEEGYTAFTDGIPSAWLSIIK